MSRTRNSIKNIIIALCSNIIIVLIGFISQKVFLNVLGEEYNGINGLFSNIISMLSVVELGLGTAIIYNLYKPIAEQNKELIKSLMDFYKRSYRKIAVIVFFLGIAVIPFLDVIVGKVSINENIYIIYILFLLDTCFSYLLIYKQSILNGHQRNYIINISYLLYMVCFNILDILILYYTGNYYLYLLVKIICRFIQNYILKIIADKLYPYINEKAEPLDIRVKQDIYIKIKALLLHKIGSMAIMSSDNIMISMLIGISSVGFYQNYKMVINQVQNLFSQVFSSITASVGNLLVEKDKSKNYSIFKKLYFLNFWMSTMCSFALFYCMNSFITLWIGEKWLLSDIVLISLVINFFLMTMRCSVGVFKDAAGIYYEDRHVPFIELFVNIITSIVLSKFLGLAGIFIGTIISNFVIHLYSFPKYVNTKLFKQTYKQYYTLFLKNVMIFLTIILIGKVSKTFVHVNNLYLSLLLDILISIVLPNVILLVLFYRNKEFVFFKDLLFDKFLKNVFEIKK